MQDRSRFLATGPLGVARRLASGAREREADVMAGRALARPGPVAARGSDAAVAPEQGVAPVDRAESARHALPAALAGSGRPLDRAERTFMEPRFGADFGSVRVHDDARARGLLDALDARGLALGEQVALAGRAEPALLAHELAHVLQQRRDGATLQFKPKEPPAVSPGVDPKFWEWWKLVVGFEGSLEAWKANPANAADKGGETNWGMTKKMYLAKAQALGLPATEAGFAALTPEQAMRFGQMMWKASGASRIDNTGVALVLADWYWGGILLKHHTAILAARGFKATYEMGSPSKATTDFINTLPPGELVQEMSDAKADQYRGHVKADPKQKPFLRGWLERNETRRKQAQPFVEGVAAPAAGAERQSLWDRGHRALRLGARAESASERQAARAALADAIEAIARRAANGFAHAEEEMSMNALSEELLDARRRLGDS